jgi:tetratricopeptide (TPR) repeat protein
LAGGRHTPHLSEPFRDTLASIARRRESLAKTLMKKRAPRTPVRAGRSGAWRLHSWVSLGVAATTFIGFAPSLDNQFVDWDDLENFATNTHYRGIGWAQLKWMWTTLLLGHYVPITWMTLGADYLIWGMNPAGYHFTNVLLHSANAAVFYLAAQRLLRLTMVGATAAHPLASRLSAVLAALIFALHPLRVESVAWITERRDVLSGLFYLFAVWAYLRDAETTSADHPNGRPWYWISLGCFLLALLSKAIAITLPMLLIVLDVYPLRRLGRSAGGWFGGPARRWWAEKVPFVVASAIVTPITLVAARNAANLFSVAHVGIGERVAISLYGLIFYLWKTIAPLDLSPFYPLRRPIETLSTPYLVSGGLVALITGLTVLLRRRWPAVGAVWLVYAITLLPVSGLLQNGPQISADRYSYLPSLSLAVLAGATVFGAWHAWTRRWSGRAAGLCLTGAGAVLVTTLTLLTWKQIGVWHDSERLWTHAAALAPSSVGHAHLGNVRRQQARWVEANEHYRQASVMRPDAPDIQVQWGAALAQQGRIGEAIDRFREALRLQPESGVAHFNWGNALLAAGETEEAIAHFREAVRLEPRGAEAYTNWGRALALQGRRDEAIAKYREALQIKPLSVPHYNWGNELFVSGDLDGAIAHYRDAVRLDPDAAEPYNNWGRALAQQGKWEEAIAKYREALVRRPNYPLASANLEHALSQAVRFRTR